MASERSRNDGTTCPRCGTRLTFKATGRWPTWCSQRCRRAAYEERRAAKNGAIAVQIVEREPVLEHDLGGCAARVLESPAACRAVLRGLNELVAQGTLVQAGKWDSTYTAATKLAGSLHSSR